MISVDAKPGQVFASAWSLNGCLLALACKDKKLRKGKIRRFMTSCKVSDYDVALLYLEQSGYDLENAVDVYLADEIWEREHSDEYGARGKRAAKAPRNRGPFWRGL